MKKLVVILLIIPIFSIGQTFEITNGQSMCMIGKGKGQDATINPYADEDYSYALIKNIGLVEFQIRVESTIKDFKQFLLKPSNKTVIKLYRNNFLYIDALTFEKVEASIEYSNDENKFPSPPPPIECIAVECNGPTTRELAPVCGCDGVTYANPSIAKCHGIKKYKWGKCEDKN